MICEGVVHGPSTYVLNHEGPCTRKSTWMIEISIEGSKDLLVIHCCTAHKERTQANQEHIQSALADGFGMEATMKYVAIQ